MSRDNVTTVRLSEEEIRAARAAALGAALQPAAWVRMLLRQDSLGTGLIAVPRAALPDPLRPRAAELPIRLSDVELRDARARSASLEVDLSTYVRALVARGARRATPKA